MKRKLLSFLTLVLVVAMALVPMLAIMSSAAEEAPALEITAADFNQTSYAANNTTKTENGYSYTSYQVMKQSSDMQWQKNSGYITISKHDFNKIEMNVTAGSFTVTVGGATVTAAKNGTVYTYDLTGKTGEIKISAAFLSIYNL